MFNCRKRPVLQSLAEALHPWRATDVVDGLVVTWSW